MIIAKSCNVISVPLKKRKIVNAEWCINICLPGSSRLGIHAVKRWFPRPAAPPRPSKSPHRRRHPGSKSRSADHPDPVFSGLSPWWFHSAPSSEAEIEGKAVSGRRRCSRLFRLRYFRHPAINFICLYGLVVWKDSQVCACWWGLLWKPGLGKKYVYAPWSPHPETYGLRFYCRDYRFLQRILQAADYCRDYCRQQITVGISAGSKSLLVLLQATDYCRD